MDLPQTLKISHNEYCKGYTPVGHLCSGTA